MKSSVIEELKKIRQERVEMGKLKIEIESRMIEMNEKIDSLEKKLNEFENKERNREATQQALMSVRQVEDSEGEEVYTATIVSVL